MVVNLGKHAVASESSSTKTLHGPSSSGLLAAGHPSARLWNLEQSHREVNLAVKASPAKRLLRAYAQRTSAQVAVRPCAVSGGCRCSKELQRALRPC